MPIVIVLTPVIGKPNLIDFQIAFENRSFKACTTLEELWDCIADQCEDEFQTLGPGYMVNYQTREHLPENLLDTYRKGKCVIVELGISSPSDRDNIDWEIKYRDIRHPTSPNLTGRTPLYNVWSHLHHELFLQKGIKLMNQLPSLTGNPFWVSLS